MVWVYFMHLKYEDNEETDLWRSEFDSCSMMAYEITAVYAISHVIHEENCMWNCSDLCWHVKACETAVVFSLSQRHPQGETTFMRPISVVLEKTLQIKGSLDVHLLILCLSRFPTSKLWARSPSVAKLLTAPTLVNTSRQSLCPRLVTSFLWLHVFFKVEVFVWAGGSPVA